MILFIPVQLWSYKISLKKLLIIPRTNLENINVPFVGIAIIKMLFYCRMHIVVRMN